MKEKTRIPNQCNAYLLVRLENEDIQNQGPLVVDQITQERLGVTVSRGLLQGDRAGEYVLQV